MNLDTRLLEALPVRDVVLLGYWGMPDQSSAGQHRDQFGEEAEKRLQTVAKRLVDLGIDVRTRLVFTKDRDRLIDAASNEYGCDSVLFPGTGSISDPARGLVLIKPDADLDRMVELLGTLFADTEVELLLFYNVETKHTQLYDATEYMLRGLADRLRELGIDEDRIEWEQTTEGERIDVISARASGFDFVVSGETEPTVRERVFGTVQSTLADETDRSLLTLRATR